MNPGQPVSLDVDVLLREDDPYPVYARWRRETPVFWCATRECWAVSRFDDVERVLKDATAFSSTEGVGPRRMLAPRFGGTFQRDPPDHARVRRVVQRAFSPLAVAEWRASARGIADELVSEIDGDDEFDAVERLAVTLPFAMVSIMLGLDPEREAWLLPHARAIANNLVGVADVDAARAGFQAFAEHFRDVAAGREVTSPAIAALVQAMASGEITERELLDTVSLIVAAGSHTTVSLISHAIQAGFAAPAVATEVRQRPELLGAFIEEVLRHDPPTHAVFRTAITGLEMHGHCISPGDRICALIGSANRDEARFSAPDTFALRDPAPRSLAFSAGAHHCLGASLARMEVEELLGALHRGGFVLVPGEARPERQVGDCIRGFIRLPVRAVAAGRDRRVAA